MHGIGLVIAEAPFLLHEKFIICRCFLLLYEPIHITSVLAFSSTGDYFLLATTKGFFKIAWATWAEK